MCERSHDAQRLRRCVEHRRKPRTAMLILFLSQRPRLILNDVFVNCCDQRPCHFQRSRKLILLKQLMKLADGVLCQSCNQIFGASVRRLLRGIRHLAFEITGDHSERAAGKIAETIGEVGVITLHQRVK